eukprot:7106786-Prymnesium_polylepis.1
MSFRHPWEARARARGAAPIRQRSAEPRAHSADATAAVAAMAGLPITARAHSSQCRTTPRTAESQPRRESRIQAGTAAWEELKRRNPDWDAPTPAAVPYDSSDVELALAQINRALGTASSLGGDPLPPSER